MSTYTGNMCARVESDVSVLAATFFKFIPNVGHSRYGFPFFCHYKQYIIAIFLQRYRTVAAALRGGRVLVWGMISVQWMLQPPRGIFLMLFRYVVRYLQKVSCLFCLLICLIYRTDLFPDERTSAIICRLCCVYNLPHVQCGTPFSSNISIMLPRKAPWGKQF